MNTHTPAPWAIAAGDNGTWRPAAADYSPLPGTLENACLMAAAPDLLEALEELITDTVIAQRNMRDAAKRDPRWEGCADAIQPRVDKARAAIAKTRI